MMHISNTIQINIEEILKIQGKYKDELIDLENKLQNHENDCYENDFLNIIEKETKKYESSIQRDLKIPYKKIWEYFTEFNNNIFQFLDSEIKNQNFDTEICIKKLNKIIFPKWIWWETISPSWQRYLKFYESWKYRLNQEFISLWWTSYYFTPPEEIENTLKNLNIFIKNTEIFPCIKYVLYIFYFWNIHPFNDGNGAIARFLFPLLYIRAWFKIIPLEYKNFFIDKTNLLFYDKWNLDLDMLFSDFIQYAKNKVS